ncbi:unnamed protein product [Caenorhabditis sp. 36 PRJEB53466]|nr:unnamed protein product [Caenorhabditis sp. 36 PRJEB53466]
MLVSRRLRLPTSSLRFFSSSHSSIPSRLTRDDVDFLWNPPEKYMDDFMKYHGQYRTVFKSGDLAQWQNSFDDDYTWMLMCLKGTTRPVATSHTCVFRPLKAVNKPILFMGFGWIDEEFRKLGVAPVLNQMCLEKVPNEKTNIVSQINEPGRAFWHYMCNKPDDEDIGSGAMEVGYKSFYKSDLIQMPKNLGVEDITVQNARDVPKKDIIRYDQKIHPYHRERYIISHLHDRDGFGKVAYDDDGKVCGIAQAVIYPAGDCNIGPLYGESTRVVQAMFASILKDIRASGKTVTQFEVRSGQLCKDSFHWITPFLKCKPSREHVCNLVYKHWAPRDIDFSKVYCPTHAQLFLV